MYEILNFPLNTPSMRRIALVSCSKQKCSHSASAQHLYTSALFKAASAYASRIGSEWYILSAKHGLVAPEETLEPYDLCLEQLTKPQQEVWAKKVTERIVILSPPPGEIVILAGSLYGNYLAAMLSTRGYRISKPLKGLSQGHRLKWLKDAFLLDGSALDLERFYDLVGLLMQEQGGGKGYGLGLDMQAAKIPPRGVYFFFEESQTRRGRMVWRVTRVGTHGVSAGSTSTLRARLRTHRGTSEGQGNHRSSVFRRHVGQALIRRDGLSDLYSSWNVGQNADSMTRATEESLERLVSQELGRFRFIVLSVLDEPSAHSDRAYIERNSIGLLSTVGRKIDPPSEGWLGSFSQTQSIRESGLWNVDHVGGTYNPAFLDVLEELVEKTLKLEDYGNVSIAPSDWHNALRRSQQLELEMR